MPEDDRPEHLSDHLRRQLSTLDRQYSYESTVQLGRFRIDTSDEPEVSAETVAAAKKIEEEAEEKKKFVRFHEFDPREVWKEERKTKTWRDHFEKWKHQLHPSMSWQAIKMIIVDWSYLAMLGISMALISMLMDGIIETFSEVQQRLMHMAEERGSGFTQFLYTYLVWIGFTEFFVIVSAMLVHYVAPPAVGSGIAEMKTILRGVVLKDYLTFKTFFVKVVGLTLALISGIPIGKLGPFVHIASIAANLLSNLAANFEGAYSNECRKSEMITAACACGVACTFSAPVGGVLYSIEVTTTYFSVQNYWRGFFAVAWGAALFRVLRVYWFHEETTLLAMFQTKFPIDAFDTKELPFFAIIGVLTGFLGIVVINFYRFVVMFLRTNKYAKKFFQQNWLVYPIVLTFIVASITYPQGYGRFLSGRFKFSRTLLDFFSNCTWTQPPGSPYGCSEEMHNSWMNHEDLGPYNVFLVLFLFTFTFLFLGALCNTMPIPCGMFIPIFVVGAAFGRLIGEIISSIYPEGVGESTLQPIFPGIYAVVGAAALSASVTHSVSVAVICCEMTGQYIYIIPLMIAVIISNAVSTYFTDSIYDVIIKIKHLPYLPAIPPSNAVIHTICVEHIMTTPVYSLPKKTTYEKIKDILIDLPKLRSFPLVDDPSSLMLIGSISRRKLIELLAKQINETERKKEAERRVRIAVETIDSHFREAQIMSASEDASSPPTSPPVATEDKPKKKQATFAPDLHLHRAKSDLDIHDTTNTNSENEAAIRPRKTSENFEIRTIDADIASKPAKRRKKKSRFTIEPVLDMVARKTSTVSDCTPHPHPPAARRRNAFSSNSPINHPVDDDSLPVAPLPSPKSSLADLGNYKFPEYSTSFTRNIGEYVKQAKQRLKFNTKHKTDEAKLEYDLFDEERREWEEERIKAELELDDAMIDAAPFQLVRKTSLYKVHSLFSLLGLNRAYVTDKGRLVGVVALRDLRLAIQQSAGGAHPAKPEHIEFIDYTVFGDRVPNGQSHHHGRRHSSIDIEVGTEQVIDNIKKHRVDSVEHMDDILTPSLYKHIVHPSTTSLYHPMLTISEEVSVSSPIVKSPESTTTHSESDERPAQPRPSILKKRDRPKHLPGLESDDVAQAVAYLRRQSLATPMTPVDDRPMSPSPSRSARLTPPSSSSTPPPPQPPPPTPPKN